MSPLRLAFLNLTRRRLPTVVALLSIALSVGCSGVLLRLYHLSNSRFASLARGGDAVIGAKAGAIDILLGSTNLEGPYPDFIPYVLAQSLQRKAGIQFADGEKIHSDFVRSAIPLVFFAKFHDFRVIGTDSSFLNRPDPTDSPLLAEGRWFKGDGEVVLGWEVARRERVRVGDRITLAQWTGDDDNQTPTLFESTVVGVTAATGSAWDRALFSDLSQAFRILASASLGGRSIWKGQVVHYFLTYLGPEGVTPLKRLINQRSVAEVISIPETRQRLQELTGSGTRLGLALSGLILLLGGLSVCAMMVTRFDAMALQLAVLRAMGYGRRALWQWLLWEGLLLGLSASLAGALVDAIFFPWIRAILGNALPPPSVVDSSLWQSFPIWLFACAATLAAGLIPLLRLYSQDVHAALKGV